MFHMGSTILTRGGCIQHNISCFVSFSGGTLTCQVLHPGCVQFVIMQADRKLDAYATVFPGADLCMLCSLDPESWILDL